MQKKRGTGSEAMKLRIRVVNVVGLLLAGVAGLALGHTAMAQRFRTMAHASPWWSRT